MKRLLLAAAFLLAFAVNAHAVMMIGFGGEAATGISYTSENFEATGYDLGAAWSESLAGGTVDEDYTTTCYEGSQCLLIDPAASGVSYAEYDLGVDLEEVWVAFSLAWFGQPPFEMPFITFLDSGGTTLAYAGYNQAGEVNVKFGSVTTTTYNAGSGHNFHWVRFKRSTGSDGIIQMYSSDADETKPGSPNKSVTTGNTNTGLVRKIRFTTYDAGIAKFDHIRIDDAVIGSDPS